MRLHLAPSVHLALASIALGAVTLAAQVPALARSLVAPRPNYSSSPLASYIEAGDELAEKNVARFIGRSMFFPPPPPPERKRERSITPTPPLPPTVLPAPDLYEGPKPTGFLGGTVFFDGRVVHVDESLDNVTLLEAASPKEIRVRLALPAHEPGEYVLRVWPTAARGFGPFIDALEPNRR